MNFTDDDLKRLKESDYILVDLGKIKSLIARLEAAEKTMFESKRHCVVMMSGEQRFINHQKWIDAEEAWCKAAGK